MSLPEYVELGGRLYAVAVVPGPLTCDGQTCDCVIDPEQQRVEVGDEVDPVDRMGVLCEAVNAALETAGDPWRIVPMTGSTLE